MCWSDWYSPKALQSFLLGINLTSRGGGEKDIDPQCVAEGYYC